MLSEISQNELPMEYLDIHKRVLVVNAEFPRGRWIWIFPPTKSLRPVASSKFKHVPLTFVYNQAASLRGNGHVGAQEHPPSPPDCSHTRNLHMGSRQERYSHVFTHRLCSYLSLPELHQAYPAPLYSHTEQSKFNLRASIRGGPSAGYLDTGGMYRGVIPSFLTVLAHWTWNGCSRGRRTSRGGRGVGRGEHR